MKNCCPGKLEFKIIAFFASTGPHADQSNAHDYNNNNSSVCTPGVHFLSLSLALYIFPNPPWQPAALSIFYRIRYAHRHTLRSLGMWSVPRGYGKIKAMVSSISCVPQALIVWVSVASMYVHICPQPLSTRACFEAQGVQSLLYGIHQANGMLPVCRSPMLSICVSLTPYKCGPSSRAAGHGPLSGNVPQRECRVGVAGESNPRGSWQQVGYISRVTRGHSAGERPACAGFLNRSLDKTHFLSPSSRSLNTTGKKVRTKENSQTYVPWENQFEDLCWKTQTVKL